MRSWGMDLVTGATGYVGGRLVPRLVEVVQGDVHDPSTLPAALDRDAARAFGLAARDAGVKRIVYLGGLGAAGAGLSDHLRSRQETGEALRSGGVPVTEFRAAVIVGSGSISFEMIRWLVERLPVMICPRWVFQRIQPVAISDVLSYLLAAPSVPGAADRVVEIGGADVLTYRDMMLGYAAKRGLRRCLVPVPVLTPRLSSHWVRWMTPVPASIARPLVEGLRNEVVVRDDSARGSSPPSTRSPTGRRSIAPWRSSSAGEVETAWSDRSRTPRPAFPP